MSEVSLVLDFIFAVTATQIIDYVAGILCALAAILVGFMYFKYSLKVLLITIGTIIVIALTHIFNLSFLRTILCVIAFVGAIILLINLNSNKKENFLFQHKKKQEKPLPTLSTNEIDDLFNKLFKTISDLSANKTGALITLEREGDLTPFLQTSGVYVDAPVTSELLETIFVNKTPLHDGAVIIRGNYIVAAAVFYQPTQKALNGKYGSRHRAAIGISEVCDAITIVVSEETGKVSFAINGDLISVPVANFIAKLKEYY